MPQALFQNVSINLPKIRPRLLIWGAQLMVLMASGVAAFLLRFEFHLAPFTIGFMQYAVPLWLLAKGVAFYCLELDKGWWRHTSLSDVVRSGIGNVLGSALGAVLISSFAPAGFPRSIYFLDLLICMHATLGIRLCVRLAADGASTFGKPSQAPHVLIYGAGAAGVMLVRELTSNSKVHYEVRGFVDDHHPKIGMKVHGIPVLGHGDHLPAIVAAHAITEILIAIPSASGAQLARILERCHGAGVPCKTVPGLAEILRGSASAAQVRDVAVEDLLGRSAVQLDSSDIRHRLENQIVLITGAAGSIGSELCRQVARAGPSALIALDAGETPLFHLAEEMRQTFPNIPFHAEIGSIQNQRRLEDIFGKYSPSVVYHAAGYKHVPLMEANIFEAIENNVLGTFTLATTAAEFGVNTFVMISSDKAVSPTNVMGVTKRIAELLIRSLQSRHTKFVSVRFGNVLGSQGSVVPLFKRQIAAAGPITVTHPDMCRYFMTIPEAVQLVLQASTIGKGGEIFVLDMGEPVKIVDLARNLILLSGLRPGIDIKIEFTGIRPGEKLYEELSAREELTVPTCHDKIRVFAGNGIPYGMYSRVETLRELCESRDKTRLLLELQSIVPEYSPSTHIEKEAQECQTKCEWIAA